MKTVHLQSKRAKWCLAGVVLSATLVAGGVWLSVNMARAQRQREAKSILENMGAIVTYHWQDEYVESPYPRWLEDMLGRDFFSRIDIVLVYDKPIPDHVAEALAVLRDLESLNLNHSTITDEKLVHIRNLRQLRHLDLGRTGIGDSGLEYVACLHALERLKLDDTRISDTGLKQLTSLQRLKTLDLCGTHVTDTGIFNLSCLQSLEEVELYNTGVTSAGVAALKTALPRLHIGHNTGSIEGPGATAGP